jgi:hypothetical protein
MAAIAGCAFTRPLGAARVPVSRLGRSAGVERSFLDCRLERQSDLHAPACGQPNTCLLSRRTTPTSPHHPRADLVMRVAAATAVLAYKVKACTHI